MRSDDPDHWYLGMALVANGQPDEAIKVLERALGTNRTPAVMGILVRAYAHAGRREEALRLLDKLEQRQRSTYVPTAAFVNAYLGLGDNEQALAWLERAFLEQSNILQLIEVHPFLIPYAPTRVLWIWSTASGLTSLDSRLSSFESRCANLAFFQKPRLTGSF